ncbi:MAG: nucleotidyltransferase, partial [bacterium]|nr:nucleotidyltransferase [bacterium]
GGVYHDADGLELAVRGDELVSMNMWGFTPELFPELRRQFRDFLARSGRISDSEFLLPDVIQALVHEGRIQVEVLRQAGQWCGITFREDKQRVAAIFSTLVARGEYPKELWV